MGKNPKLKVQYFSYTGRETGLSSHLRLLPTLSGDRILRDLPYMYIIFAWHQHIWRSARNRAELLAKTGVLLPVESRKKLNMVQ